MTRTIRFRSDKKEPWEREQKRKKEKTPRRGCQLTMFLSQRFYLQKTRRYLKSTGSGVSKKPFNLYASMSLFGMLYPMCFEYAEMVRFYHSVYRVVYHPQVI